MVLNAVFLPGIGWYRVDARGNREGVDARFTPPQEQLAFEIRLPQEADFSNIFYRTATSSYRSSSESLLVGWIFMLLTRCISRNVAAASTNFTNRRI